MDKQGTHQRVVDDYFRTTSGSTALDEGHTDATIAGLRRRIGTWLNVSDRDVLDLGSGLGETCFICRQAGAKSITGVNLSFDEIAYAKKHVDASFVHQDVAEFLAACKPETFDCIFALNFLEHLDKDKLVEVLDGARRVLRPGGTLVAMVPNATSPFGCMTRYWDITHFNAFTPSSFHQLARLCGFSENVEFRECGPVAHGLVSSIRYLLWQGMRLSIKFRLLVEVASTKGGIYSADMMVRLSKVERMTKS